LQKYNYMETMSIRGDRKKYHSTLIPNREGGSFMRLSTKSRYATRVMLDMAKQYNKGAIHSQDIAARQDISLKYLEQIIIPLKKACYIKSVRGAKGGHMLAKPPEDIRIGEIVALLEGGQSFTKCSENPEYCEQIDTCLTRPLWTEAARAMFEKLNSYTLSDLIEMGKRV
jgi:Rrf2 family iron-sulfur cluster assembly transcriptional regulator